jgi:hypothetical protein
MRISVSKSVAAIVYVVVALLPNRTKSYTAEVDLTVSKRVHLSRMLQ